MNSTLLSTIHPHQMKATSEDVQQMNNAFDLFQPNKAVGNFAESATI